MKYFIYCRKSSEEDTRQTQSLDTQQRMLVEYASKHKLQVVDIIKESKSAKDDHNRPLFTQMLQRVQNGEADAILVVHTDRLARNFIDAGFIIKLIESKVLTEVRTLTSVFNSVPSLMYMGFDFVFASHYSRDLSVKVKAGNESKLLKGEYPGLAPIGYMNVQPGKGIVPDPIRAPFITQSFELFATGDHSVKSLAKHLFEAGFRTRTGKRKSPSSIHRILTNPEYYGMIRRKEKLYAGKHMPLISKDVFDTVQAILENRSRPKRQNHTFTFRDFVTCDVCGCNVTAGVTKGKYIYYRCTNGKGACSQHKKYWNEQHVSDQFALFFDDFTLDPIKANTSFEMYKKSFKSKTVTNSQNKTALKQQLDSLERKITKLEDMLLADRITPERYDNRKLDIENEIAQITVLLKQKFSSDSENTLELVEKIKNQAIKLSEIYNEGDDEVKRDLLKSVLWNSTLKDGKIASTRLTKLWQPLKDLNKSNDLEIWRKRWDSNCTPLTSGNQKL